MRRRKHIYNDPMQMQLFATEMENSGTIPSRKDGLEDSNNGVSQTLNSKNVNGEKSQVIEPKKLDALLQRWKEEFKGKRETHYCSAIREFFKKALYDFAKILDAVRLVYANEGWSERNIWPKTALIKFLIWIAFKSRCDVAIDISLIWEYWRSQNTCPAIRSEIETVYAKHKIGRKKRKARQASINEAKNLVEAMRLLLLIHDPTRSINSLNDFSEKDARYINEYVETHEVSILTLSKADPASYTGQQCRLSFLFKEGHKNNSTIKDIFMDCRPKKIEAGTRTRVFSLEEIEKLRTVAVDKYKNMDIDELFNTSLSNTVCSALFEAAFRAEDAADFAKEDIDYTSRSPANSIILGIRHGKERDPDDIDLMAMPFTRLEQDLKRHWKIVDRYCKEKGINPPVVFEKGRAYHLVFFNKKGNPLKPADITQIVKKQCAKVGIKLEKGEAAHLFRHSKLTWLGRLRMPRHLMKKHSRHLDDESLNKYCHGDLYAAQDWFDEHIGNTMQKNVFSAVTAKAFYTINEIGHFLA